MNLDGVTSGDELVTGIVTSDQTITIGVPTDDIYTWAPNAWPSQQHPVWTKTPHSIFQALVMTMGAQALLELYRLLVTKDDLSDELKEVRSVIETNLENLVTRAY